VFALGRQVGVLGVLLGSITAHGFAEETSRPVVVAVLCRPSRIPMPLAMSTTIEATEVLAESEITLSIDVSSTCDARPLAHSRPPVIVRFDAVPHWSRLHPPPRGVGSIPFIDGEPGRVILLSVWAAVALIERDLSVRSLFDRVPERIREQWIGRMLGRALAHEIGHYVLRSSHHSARGLMRASHTVEAFVGVDRSPFRLSAGDRQLLAARTAGVVDTNAAGK